MDQSQLEPFLLSRFIDYSKFSYYYPFGNSPAEDFLRSVANETRPSILSLGCGDIRSCFYTLWKHFGPESESSFTSVHFVLNDVSAAVLARNILFLSLCLTMPEDDATSVRTRELLAAFWSIWYNHELLPKHRKVLVAALARLVEWSESRAKWSECELGSLVEFTSDTTFQAIRKIWVWWQKGGVRTDVSVSQVKIFREAFLKIHCSSQFNTPAEQHAHTASIMIDHKHFALKDENHALKASMIKDLTTFMDSGNAYAETVLDLPLYLRHTFILYERNDYTLHYGLVPYEAFTEYPQYSPSFVARATLKKNTSQLPVSDDKHFTQTPLLANSVQQFGMWVLAASKMIKHSQCGAHVNLSFTFDCGDAITFCQCLKQFPSKYAHMIGPVPHFDVIDTSNLFDHIPPAALILMCASILKPAGTIFSASLRYKEIGFTGNEYLEKFFGFPPELFPVLFGIRCIDQEGQYSSKVATLPVPFNLLHTGMSKHAPKLFVWQKVDREPLRITSLDDENTICGALCSASVIACTYHLKPETSDLMQILSVEVFLVILHQFASHLHPDVATSSYQFWEPLCQIISQKAEMKPHLLQLQTQSLLHGFHMHFILSEKDCPVCNNQPVLDFIGQYSVSIADNAECSGPPYILTADRRVLFNRTPMFIVEIQAIGGVNYITSLAGHTSDSELKLHFFLPRHLAQCKFEVMTEGQNLPPILIVSGCLQESPWTNPQYSFLSAHSQQRDVPTVSPLGEILKHTGNASVIVTIISMSDACVAAKQTYPLETHQTTISNLQLKCGDRLQCTICYPYAIDYSKVRIKVSRGNRTITVIATRSPSTFHNEHPIFLVDPDNRMAFPPTTFEYKTITEYCSLQSAAGDQQDVTLLSYYDIKSPIMWLFVRYAEKRQRHFYLSPNQAILDSSVIILVHELLFDIHFQTPALDLSYCFVNTLSEAMHKGLIDMMEVRDYLHGRIDKPEYELLKMIFAYFASLTRSQQSRSRYGILTKLEKKKISQHFQRAVIYPLYPDPDVRAQEFGLTIDKLPYLGTTGKPTPRNHVSNPSATTEAQEKEHEQESSNPCTTSTWKMSCIYCNKPSEDLKKCSRCLAVHYCSKECQTKHWRVHKEDCNRGTTGRDTTIPETPHPKSGVKQSFTEDVGKSTEGVRASSAPSRCAKCGKVKDGTKKYCSIECQLDKPQQQTDGSKESTLISEPSSCSRCGKESIKKCSSCQSVFYCSIECQRLDWPWHKTECGKHCRQ